MTDTPVYFMHCTIPQQHQGEMHKCLDTWLRQGIITPSQNLYTSKVVNVHKKSGEICLCKDCQKLTYIMVIDVLLLPRVDETLWAFLGTNWFSSFDLTQGYLQLAMEESAIKKTIFRARPMSLYECTHMPFGLSNAGFSFCHLIEQDLREEQLSPCCCILKKFYFSSTIDVMLDWIELVSSRIGQFNPKIKPKMPIVWY